MSGQKSIAMKVIGPSEEPIEELVKNLYFIKWICVYPQILFIPIAVLLSVSIRDFTAMGGSKGRNSQLIKPLGIVDC